MQTRPKTPLTTITLAALALVFAACDPEPTDTTLTLEAPSGGAYAAEEPQEVIEVESVDDVPTFSIALEGGGHLAFFVDELDGSVGMLEELPVDAGVASLLEDPRLRDASPAQVFYALTPAGTEIPEPLRAHHEGLAADGVLPPLDEALVGNERDITAAPLANSESPCWNPTFVEAHCDHPDYAEAQCWTNASGDLTWNVPGADRYKAGFCLQAGTARSWLYYRQQAGDCNYFYLQNFVWGSDSYWNGTKYSATTYRSYVWWRSSGGLRRSFYHAARGDAGAVYDFGNRYTWGYGCP
jgi:hypothetical protein